MGKRNRSTPEFRREVALLHKSGPDRRPLNQRLSHNSRFHRIRPKTMPPRSNNRINIREKLR